jgi:hypothetical protein
MDILQITQVNIIQSSSSSSLPWFPYRKADHMLEIVSEDKSELRKHKIAYGKDCNIVCLSEYTVIPLKGHLSYLFVSKAQIMY